MSDHEHTPPEAASDTLVSALVKAMPQTTEGPTQPSEAPPSGFAVAAAPAPSEHSAPLISEVVTQQFSFQFMMEAKHYQANILLHPINGPTVDLQKYKDGAWVKSLSRVRWGILGAYLYHQAVQGLNSSNEPEKKKPSAKI